MTAVLGGTLLLLVVASTLAGGSVPLRFDRHARTFLSFSAGTLVGLALLELIPAGIEGTPGNIHTKLLLVMGAFLITMLLDKLHVLHPHSHRMDVECPPEEHEHAPLAIHGAIGLLVHSAVDGLALAAALRESPATAVAVGMALSAHKFADGLTTVSLVLAHHHRRAQAVRLLAGNVLSLLVGFAAGLGVAFREGQVGGLLLVMAGFFLYLGATDLIPSVTVPVCRKRDVFATACGMAAIAAIAALAHS
jgi:zinc transporter ZupT